MTEVKLTGVKMGSFPLTLCSKFTSSAGWDNVQKNLNTRGIERASLTGSGNMGKAWAYRGWVVTSVTP